MLHPSKRTLLTALVGLAGLLSPAPAPAVDPGPAVQPAQLPGGAAAAASRGPENSQDLADRRLEARLSQDGGGVEGQTVACLRLAWDENEPDSALREAARRRLRTTDARVVADGVVELIGSSLPRARIGMLELMAEVYTGLGGRHSFVDSALSAQIRFSVPEVARAAIAICSRLGIPDAYLPMRELASQPASPLRSDAIAGIARLRDPRAVGFLSGLLEKGPGSGSPEEIFQALAEIGRPAALVLKTKLDDPSPAIRGPALDALLRIATAEDLTSLYAYVEKYKPQGEVKKRVYDKIAEIEASQFARPVTEE